MIVTCALDAQSYCTGLRSARTLPFRFLASRPGAVWGLRLQQFWEAPTKRLVPSQLLAFWRGTKRAFYAGDQVLTYLSIAGGWAPTVARGPHRFPRGDNSPVNFFAPYLVTGLRAHFTEASREMEDAAGWVASAASPVTAVAGCAACQRQTAMSGLAFRAREPER